MQDVVGLRRSSGRLDRATLGRRWRHGAWPAALAVASFALRLGCGGDDDEERPVLPALIVEQSDRTSPLRPRPRTLSRIKMLATS